MKLEWVTAQFPEIRNLASLNVGGQKWVFSGDHDGDGSIVLKIVKPSMGVDIVSREMIAVAKVAGSNRVPRIHAQESLDTDFGLLYWFREQRVHGQTLQDMIANRVLSTEQYLRLAQHILEALVVAEAEHIVHRDIKPGNILCDQVGDFWLIDFGFARHLQLTSLTSSADQFGKCTPGYAPPEQFNNQKRDIDTRADLFALGVTLYESIVGYNYYREGARDLLEVLRAVEKRPLPRLKVTIPGGDDFADLVASMTQRRRDHRPRSAAESLDWLQEIIAKQ